MSDATKLKFLKQEIDDIRKCLRCPLPDCNPIACPFLISDEAKAYARYREKERKRRQELYQKRKLEWEQKKRKKKGK